MRLRKIRYQNFRNIRDCTFQPSADMNVFFGENAQGKTNLVEGMWMMSAAHSFRGAKDAEVVTFGEDTCAVGAWFCSGAREQTVQLDIVPKKQAFLNEMRLESTSLLCAELPMVVFSPTHLALVRDGPIQRRRFLDDAIAPLFPSYGGNLQYYARALRQRNSLLKDMGDVRERVDQLDVWDQNLARSGAQIIRLRQRYVEMLQEKAAAFYAGISREKEALTVEYQCTLGEVDVRTRLEELRERFLEALRESREMDFRNGSTSLGAHLDDMELLLGERSARRFGSQGQQRSCVLALKLAECGIIETTLKKKPVVLLDDVFSELDAGRRAFLLASIQDRQVFMTNCAETAIPPGMQGKRFLVQAGEVREV